MRVLVTGGSGCVGHYLVDWLVRETDWEVFLLLRNPAKLRVPLRPGVQILPGGLETIGQYRDLIGTMTAIVSAAACWGGPETFEINRDRTLELFSYAHPAVCQRAIYFSTASILDRDHTLLRPAGEIGDDYIRSKYACLEPLEQSAIGDRLITLFPTLVFGGNEQFPRSHLTGGLREVTRHIGLIRFFKAEGSFHFIHGADIAQAVGYLLRHPEKPFAYPARVVLGMPAIAVNQAIREVAAYLGKRIYGQFDLTPAAIAFFIRVFHLKMAPWDFFCIERRHFTYNVLNFADWGLVPHYPTAASLLRDAGL